MPRPLAQEPPIKHALTLFAAATLLALGATQASAAPTYRIKDLGVGPGGYSSQALAINDDNVVVGWIQRERYGDHHAVVFKAGSIVSIGTLPGDTSSYAYGINNLGQVVGYSGAAQTPRAFVYDAANGIQALGTLDPAHPYSIAEGISDNGTIVGQSKTATGVPHAFLWTAAKGMVDPTPNEPGWSDAPAINSRGEWVGHLDRGDRTIGVRVSAKGKPTDLGAFDASAPYSYGKGLNEVGQVAGYSADPATLASRAFVWDKATGMTDIGLLPGGFYSNGLAVNDAGQVVGIADKPAGRGTTNGPFYFDKETGIVDLATLVDPADPLYGKVAFDAAQDINNHGVIVANGIINEKYHAFLLIPKKKGK
ncbi:MAG TPA: DUF3466 family protein [Ideonella sp.]|nr:DUF3466 family protein [Ideonella sp.]